MNNSKTEINNGWTVQDEILYRDILEEEVVHGQKIQTYDEIPQLNVAQRPIKEVNKEVKEIKNQDCFEMHNGEFFKIDPVENEILYKEIIQSYNGNIAQGSIMMANKQDDRLMDFGDAEDEIDVKIIQDYNRLILEKKLHTSN